MPPIGEIGTTVTVTPGDEIAVVRGPDDCEYVDDRSPFSLVVSGTVEDRGQLVGMYGKVVSGHQRYLAHVATLLLRVENSDWRRDNRSGANFKVGRSVARLNGKYPFYHPHGTDIDGFPFIMRYGSLDSRGQGEATVNSAIDCCHGGMAEPDAGPNDEERDGL